MTYLQKLLSQSSFSKKDIIVLLELDGNEQTILLEKAREAADRFSGNKVYLRGLIEYSNVCIKNCHYCGIRRGNKNQQRYTMQDEEVLECARFAYEQQYGSIVLQSGERSDKFFTGKIEYLLKEIKKLSQGKLGITLSLGEQSPDTFKRWFDAGAHRYLLRIETSNRELYARYHPDNDLHSFDKRLKALEILRNTGYQVGTGVMIGLPGQSIEHLADDLLFIKQMDVDMVGMGPYIEHEHTPMFSRKDLLLSLRKRFMLSLSMLSVLRLMMPDINIAATTAMQAIDTLGREKAILAGANVIMPNLTPVKYRENYLLYNGKPCMDEDPYQGNESIQSIIQSAGCIVGLGEWGDSLHFNKR